MATTAQRIAPIQRIGRRARLSDLLRAARRRNPGRAFQAMDREKARRMERGELPL